jgi:hypothetical protein
VHLLPREGLAHEVGDGEVGVQPSDGITPAARPSRRRVRRQKLGDLLSVAAQDVAFEKANFETSFSLVRLKG